MTTDPIINLITALWLGGLGACIGSFLNVVAYRLPLGMSVVWKPSHCPKCGHAIRARDNVPVFGWLWLRGKCRDCGEGISARYAIVEALMGLAFFVLAYFELFGGGGNLPQGPISEFVGAMDNVWVPYWPLIGLYAYHGLLLSLLMSVTLIDLDGQRVPSKLFSLGLIAGVGLAGWYPILQPALSVNGMSISLSGVVGAGVGWLVGVATVRLLSMFSSQHLANSGRNLIVGFVLLGAFLGWQGVAAMTGVAFVAGVGAIFQKDKGRWLAAELFVPAALVQLAFWKPLAEAIRSITS